MKSLYSGVSGLKTHNQRMDVIGNNIANVNTTGFKTGTVTFKDVYYQTKTSGSGGDGTSGGVNPKQVGYGASLGTIGQVMTQSGFTYSDSIYDCALQGEGFFQVMDDAGNIFYTRSGIFNVDNAGNLTDANGYIVLGVTGDPTGVSASSQRISLIVPDVQNNVASATRTVTGGYSVTISAAEYGPNGNISITFQNSEVPFASFSGSNLMVQLDLSQEFATQQDFEDAVNAAIRAGGVNIPEGVLPIKIEFDSTPADTSAVAASNIMEFTIASADEDGEAEKMYLKFDVDVAGEFGNKYEINMSASKTATSVTAKWSDGVLSITVPGGTDSETGEPLYNVTLEDIQNAINKAAGMTDSDGDGIYDDEGTGNDKLKITVTAVDENGEEGGTDVDGWDFASSLKTNTKRLGLSGGADNFYNEVATSLATVKLENGRFEAAQTHQELSIVVIENDGVIYGEHPVHGRLLLGRIDVVTFANPGGLSQVGTSYWKATPASGEAEVKIAGEDGSAEIVQGALEMSNVDLSQEFSDMIITQRGFQANSRIITVSDTMLEELINLKR